jgi:NAD(P)-dependent dehydrogenase (short-subunit alcohol dehydrogenase family)
MGIAVVTGANSGIGLATTIRLALDGHVVYGAMRDLDKAAKLQKAALKAELPDGSVNLLRIDVTDDDIVARAFALVKEQSGPVDILVNNAGLGLNLAIEDATIADFQRLYDANVLGIVRCTQAVLPDMRAAGTGTIVNVGSVAGRLTQPTMGAYNASKFAVEGLTEVLAQEVITYGIRVALIEPGTIRTPIFAKSVPMPEDTAYPMHYERVLAFFAKTLQAPTEPSVVADCISHAITTEEPMLRYVVGDDGVATLAGRATTTDEELIAMSALETPDYLVAFSEHFGLDIT